MNIKLAKLELDNWQGGNGEYQFQDLTNVSADNGRGKSRLYRAFLFCLFGKDDTGKTDIDVFTIENGEYTTQNASVSVTIELGDKEYKLTTESVQKRNKEGKYEGSSNRYYLNNVPFGTKKEYQDFVNSLVDEDTFRMVTNPTHFLALPWKDQRAKLFEISNVDVDEVQGYENIKNLDISIEAYRKSLLAQKNKLNTLVGTENKQGELDIRIEQTSSFIADESELEQYVKQQKKLEKQLKDIDAVLSSKNDTVITTLQEKILELEEQKIQKQKEQHAKINEQVDLQTKERNKKRLELEQKTDTIEVVSGKIAKQKKVIEALDAEVLQRRNEYSKEYKQQFIGEVRCPITGKPCADSDVVANANTNFIKAQTAKLGELANAGREKKAELEKAQAELKQMEEDKAKYEKEMLALEKEIMAIPIGEYVPLDKVPTDTKIEAQIKELSDQLKGIVVTDNSAMVEQRETIEEELNEVKKKLLIKETNDVYRKEIEKLQQQKDECVTELYKVQQQIDEVEAYNKAVIDLSTEKINAMFTNVQFQLYKYNLVGTAEECCIARNQRGVKIAQTNTAGKIQAGLEIINVLSKQADVYAPIFIDNRESITNIPQMECQIINLIKTKDQEITISYE